MGVLNHKDEKKSSSVAQEQSGDIATGYERPLFVEDKERWSDDRMLGGGMEKQEVRYHDKENVLKVTKGLCHDIFFRAEDIHRPDFDQIPDFAEPVKEESKGTKLVEHKKPLNSKQRNRTYLLDPEQKEEEPVKRPKKGSRRRKARKKPSRRRRK